ncbi:MAG TPA: hypothetical protein VJT49_22945 [Amycolatopsis sp.]|uniref:hypothetical protein n=1 Tax=Amycolatopsis sp. TaxID=37632 RepID=UPI002B46BF8D|nr:hypothetical protein [Amycolatopsis sp.]HKS47915.1 hypothetical protein [Amycolatopsis sp.]
MPERQGFPFDTEEARLDAELTRQELGETAQELANRAKTTSQRLVLGAGAAFGLGVILLFVIRKFLDRR